MPEKDASGKFVKKDAPASPAATDTEQQPVNKSEVSDADKAELEQFRKEKAEREAREKAEAEAKDAEATKLNTLTADEQAELEAYRAKKKQAEAAKEAGRPYWADWSTEDQIRDHYMHARGTIQDYARIYKLSVDEVLLILDMEDLAQVETLGDLIDQDVLKAGDKPLRSQGDVAKVPFSTN